MTYDLTVDHAEPFKESLRTTSVAIKAHQSTSIELQNRETH